MTATTEESVVDLKVYELLEEFMSLLRKGQGIPVREFAQQYPEFSDRITADFPALLMAEGLKPRISMAPGITAVVDPGKAPELLAGYRVLRQIGQGGMGVVYEAEHPRLSRKLAIKVLLGRKSKSDLAERFRREAEAVSRLNHPNIVQVFDFGEHNGVPYLAMPLVDGYSLDRMLEEYRSANSSQQGTRSSAGLLTMATNGRSSKSHERTVKPENTGCDFHRLIGPEADFKQLAKIGADVASALTHAHENGTIHRDIKPGNLILDGSGKIWVTDFGLAKVRDEANDLSRSGDVIGTPRFMSPEQMRGLCDERSDIYSLGITLYEMASGTRAWDSLNTAQLLKVRESAELPELSAVAPFIPKPLADIIMKACSTRPEDRYPSAKEMQTVLNRFAHGQKTGDRRRRPRNGSSFLDRQWVIGACSIGVPVLTFAVMFVSGTGPWAPAQLTTPEALLSLVQDDSAREKVIQQMPDLIEAAITAKDPNVHQQAADLTLKVVEEALKKAERTKPAAEITPEEVEAKDKLMGRIKDYTEEYKKSGFVYDKMDHPLTNAIRNLDLAQQISELTLAAEDKLSAQAKIASIGEAIRKNLVTTSQMKSLLDLLPAEAQRGPSTAKVPNLQLVRFIMALNSTFDSAKEKLSAEEAKLASQLEQELKEQGTISKTKHGTPKLPDGLKLPPEFRGKLPPELQGQVPTQM